MMKACAVAALAALVLPAHGQGIGSTDKDGKKDHADETLEEAAEDDCYKELREDGKLYTWKWCTMPYINHAVVLFGATDDKKTYATDAHTIGNSGSGYLRGVAINGSARFARGKSMTIDGTHHVNASIVTGDIFGNADLIHWDDGLKREIADFEAEYDQNSWIKWANDLWDAKTRGDKNVQRRVRFYLPEREYNNTGITGRDRVMTIKRDSPDYVSPNQQVVHVMIGEGRLRADNDLNNKIDGVIIAPQGEVQIHRRWQHLHGFIVAKTLREWWPGYPSDTGLQIHGQLHGKIECTVPEPTCESPPNATERCDENATEFEHWCKMPNIEHAVVAFGDEDKTNEVAIIVNAHTFGKNEDGFLAGAAGRSDYKIGPADGAAVDGHSIFGGVARDVKPNFNAGYLEGAEGAAAFAATYKLEEWTRFVDQLFESHERGDPHLSVGKGGNVRFYDLTEDEPELVLEITPQENVFTASTTEVHVVRGEGKVRVPCYGGEHNTMKKFYGSIIAPEAIVRIDQCGGFVDGLIVSKKLREGVVNGVYQSNAGLQIHGLIPKIECTCLPLGRGKDCEDKYPDPCKPPPLEAAEGEL